MGSYALEVALTGFVIEMLGIAIYFSKLIKNKVPKTPAGLFSSLFAGVVFGGLGLYWAIPSEPLNIILVAIPAVIAMAMGGFFLYILANKNTPIGELKVAVGDSVLPFSSQDSQGHPFTNESLLGQRTLLKFYRGSWCAYCSRELAMFEEMKPDFDKHQVKIVALSGDSVDEAAHHKVRDGLSHTLLSDPQLEAVKTYGVEHQKAFGADSNNIMTVFGLPFPKPHQFKFKSMSIPTSLLIDENGIIRWIDQSEDYRLRASRDRILQVLNREFGDSPARSKQNDSVQNQRLHTDPA